MTHLRAPVLSLAIKSFHFLPQIRFTTFQPAALNIAPNSVIILEFPLTGPSNLCKLQLITNTRLFSFSLAASEIDPIDSGSSISPSPQNIQIFLSGLLSSKPLCSRYFITCA